MNSEEVSLTDARVAEYPLMQPFQLRHSTLENRVMSTSHAILYQVDGVPQQRYQLYREEKAKGGIALTMFGGSSNVARDSPSTSAILDLARDSITPHFQQFSDRIHRYDCALMCQTTHMERRAKVRAAARRCKEGGLDGCELFRVGDAVSCRDIHWAILDSRRLCKDP